MRVMVLGERAREHAIAKIVCSRYGREAVVVAPGNDYLGQSFRCCDVDLRSFDSINALAKREGINFVMLADEELLAKGISDHLAAEGIEVFGCTREASRVESSKAFAKKLFQRLGIPTPPFHLFSRGEEAIPELAQLAPPWVIKMDGFASGKGVTVTADIDVAKKTLLSDKYLSRPVLVETYAKGVEAGLSGIVRKGRLALCWEVWDYKRRFDGDSGPLTGGGMGAVVLEPRSTGRLISSLQSIVDANNIQAGFINLNTIETRHGELLATEVNVHIGTPECEALAAAQPEAIAAAIVGESRSWSQATAVGIAITLVSPDYPSPSPLQSFEVPRSRGSALYTNSLSLDPSSNRGFGSGRLLTIAAAGPTIDDVRASLHPQVIDIASMNRLQSRSDIGLHQPRT